MDQGKSLNLNLEIVVVDNNPDGIARSVFEEFKDSDLAAFKYVHEARSNISLARNAGIANSESSLVAFIDDDEQAQEHWLERLVSSLREFDADAVFGPTFPVFEGGQPPTWDPEGKFYTRNRGLTTGTEIRYGPTSNVLVKRATCLPDGEQWFDPELGLTFGHDLLFFMKLAKKGRKFIWCSNASVTEHFPKSRLTVDYILRRTLESYQRFVQISAAASERPILIYLKWTLVGLAQTAIWVVPNIILAPFNTPISVRVKSRLAGAIGKFAWSNHFTRHFYE